MLAGLGRVRTLAALAEACGVARITIKRIWEPARVLPPATFVDDSGTRWYSDAYIKAAGAITRTYRRHHRHGQRDLGMLAALIEQEFERRRVR